MSYSTLLLTMFQAFLGIAAVLSACEIGQGASDRWNEVNVTIGQFHWYLFPNELKRILPTIIAIAQQPVELECFASFSLSREVFKKVS